ncbi:MAG: metalloregulator ArsR/SmtB family transcription factor [Chthoniobacterales bacterium]
MKQRITASAPRVFKTLSDPTRLRLLNLLAKGEVCVCDLASTLAIVQPKVSRHLAYLRRAGLVDARREGKWMHYRQVEHPHPAVRHVLMAVRAWMAHEPPMARDLKKLKRVCCETAARETRKQSRKDRK